MFYFFYFLNATLNLSEQLPFVVFFSSPGCLGAFAIECPLCVEEVVFFFFFFTSFIQKASV